jgi:hypothetical protein
MADTTPKRKPLLIDPRMLMPLPKALWGTACDNCNRPQSKWRIFSPMKRPAEPGAAIPITDADFGPTCSVCFLYESPWSKQRREDIQRFITDLEHEIGEKFLVDPDGRLTPNAADRALGAIALTSRMFEMQDQMQGMKE